jgi:REP element-mobilizing transposase RayT
MLRGIEKRQIDDEKDRQDSDKYLGDLAEETEARIYAWLSMTNYTHLLPLCLL